MVSFRNIFLTACSLLLIRHSLYQGTKLIKIYTRPQPIICIVKTKSALQASRFPFVLHEKTLVSTTGQRFFSQPAYQASVSSFLALVKNQNRQLTNKISSPTCVKKHWVDSMYEASSWWARLIMSVRIADRNKKVNLLNLDQGLPAVSMNTKCEPSHWLEHT